jgi:aldehyde dehydrogenase (NAD+)
MTGCDIEDALQEVDLSIERLFHWGAYADKYGGAVQVREDMWRSVVDCLGR